LRGASILQQKTSSGKKTKKGASWPFFL